MVHGRAIFIIPGFAQRPTNKAYKEVAKILKSEGYFPILVAIPWKNSTISQNTEHFLKIYKKTKARKKYILGFSYGAMIAFIAATKVNPSGIILCSLSPYFKEDMPKTNKNLSLLMTARYEDFSKLHCGTLAKKIKTGRILMLYGAQETKVLIKRVTDAFGQIPAQKKHLIPILKAEHEIGDKRYLNTIHYAVSKLL